VSLFEIAAKLNILSLPSSFLSPPKNEVALKLIPPKDRPEFARSDGCFYGYLKREKIMSAKNEPKKALIRIYYYLIPLRILHFQVLHSQHRISFGL
jgi:hypothetical protein